MPGFQLIVNADDFGFTRGVNDGILEAHRQGILTATTLMAGESGGGLRRDGAGESGGGLRRDGAGGAAFDHAVEMARATPSLDVGVHLVLWEDSGLPQRLPSFVFRAMTMSTAAIERLFSAQVERVIQAGIAPSHLDTHKHTHTLPHVMRAVERTALRFGIGWVRRQLPPFGLLTKRPVGLRTTDHFLGLGLTGKMTRDSLAAELRGIRPGLTELMCHPGRYDAALEASPTRLKRQRQEELTALTAPEIRALLEANGIKLTSYRKLS
jgi:predicted glycoside hydrolase/deacetylase ChbG (UPF0249 family)